MDEDTKKILDDIKRLVCTAMTDDIRRQAVQIAYEVGVADGKVLGARRIADSVDATLDKINKVLSFDSIRELADCMTYERASTGVDRRDRFERPRDCVPTLEELK